MPRKADITRDTKETQIKVSVDLDGTGASIDTSVKFLDHMLELLARHSDIQLMVKATGDLKHHIIEDIGIVLGQSLEKALGDKIGIERYGSSFIPMDETLGFCALDLSGRAYFVMDFKFQWDIIEDIAVEDIIHFFEALALNAKINLHIDIKYGNNDHHKAEAAIKAFSHALKKAITVSSDILLSTKGKLSS